MWNDLKLRCDRLPAEIWICPAPQRSIASFRQIGGSATEAGGILLGYRRGQHLEVLEATVPQAKDIRKRARFYRSDTGHQTIATDRWRQSDGYIHYLGEWHTHPESEPTPSSFDRREWIKLSRRQPHPLLFIIVGTTHWYVEFKGESWLPTIPTSIRGGVLSPT